MMTVPGARRVCSRLWNNCHQYSAISQQIDPLFRHYFRQNDRFCDSPTDNVILRYASDGRGNWRWNVLSLISSVRSC